MSTKMLDKRKLRIMLIQSVFFTINFSWTKTLISKSKLLQKYYMSVCYSFPHKFFGEIPFPNVIQIVPNIFNISFKIMK